jgi:hypothetical protein
MSKAADDDAWLDVLQGADGANDPSLHQARQLRGYFLQQARMEWEQPADPEAEKRIMNLLHARGAFPQSATRPPARSGGWQGLLDRIWPAPWDRGFAYAAIAGIAVAAIALPLVIPQEEPRDDAPKTIRPGGPAAIAAEQAVFTSSPVADAQALAAALTDAGVRTRLAPSRTSVQVLAEVEPAARPGAERVLNAYGLELPADGRIRVRFLRHE